MELYFSAYLSTEFFDLDEPCIAGDWESAQQIIKYVKNFKKSSSFKFCQADRRKSEFIVETLTGHSLEMAKEKWHQVGIIMFNSSMLIILQA